MAYPTVSAPYGFKPVNLQGGRVYSGSTRMFPIPMAYATNIFNGDIVGLSNGAAVAMPSGYNAGGNNTAAAGSGLGVFVGCEYSNSSQLGVLQGPIYGKNRYQYFLGGTAATDAVAYVVDDPLAYFRVAVLAQPQAGVSNTTATTIGYMSPAFVGSNAYVVTGGFSGSTASGDSGFGVSGGAPAAGTAAGNSKLTSTTTPFRIIQLVPDTAVTVTTTSGSTALSSATQSTVTVTSSTGIQPGMVMWWNNSSNPGARQGDYTYVTGVSGTTITFTAPNGVGTGSTIKCDATNIAGNATLTFVGYPEVIVGWNFGYQTYNLAAGV